LAVGGIDPQLLRIVAARRALEARERGAAVRGLVARRVDRVDDVGILGIDVHAAVVAALAVSNAAVVLVYLLPGVVAVVRAVQAPVADDEHALRIGVHRDGDGVAAGETRESVPR